MGGKVQPDAGTLGAFAVSRRHRYGRERCPNSDEVCILLGGPYGAYLVSARDGGD
jgi:hypothetical protein